MLTSLILRVIARSSDSIVKFVVAFDAKLDTFLAAHDVEVAGFEQDIVKIEKQAEAAISDLRDQITDKLKTAATIKAIKDALPTA